MGSSRSSTAWAYPTPSGSGKKVKYYPIINPTATAHITPASLEIKRWEKDASEVDRAVVGSIIRAFEAYGSRLTCRGSWPPDPHSVTNLFFFSRERFLSERTVLALVDTLTAARTAPSRLWRDDRIGTDPSGYFGGYEGEFFGGGNRGMRGGAYGI